MSCVGVVPAARREPRERRRARSPTAACRAWRRPTSRPCRWRGCRTSRSTAPCAAPRRPGRRTCRRSWCRPSAPARCRRRPSAPGCRRARGWSGTTSMQWVNWVRRSPPGLDAARPRDDHRVAGRRRGGWPSACPTGTACCWRAPRPPRSAARVWKPPSSSMPPYFSISASCSLGVEHDAVEERRLVERAGERALHAGAVVAPDVDDQRVVELAHLLDRVEQPADVPVGVLGEAGEHLHLAGVELLLGVAQRVPGREEVGALASARCPAGRCRASSGARASSRGRRPSRRRTGPCTCRPTPWRRGAARGVAAGRVVQEPRLVRRPGRARRAATRPPCR